MNPDILPKTQERVKAHQVAMAKNIAQLKTRAAKKRQAHLLCQSLKQSLKARA